MQAVKVFPAQERVELGDVEPPSMAEDDDVLLRVLDVGACGTDREICAFNYGTPPVESDYLVLGHECLAEVVEAGPGVSRVAVGDLVVPMVRRPCAHPDCLPCRDQRQDFCVTGDFVERGIKQAHGFMTELVVDSERYLNVVPAALRDIGVLAEPLTIAEKARAQVYDVQDRLPWGDGPHRAVVLGAGPVGLLGTMMLVNAGYDTTVYSLLPKPNPGAAMAEALGCEYVSSQEVTPAELARGIGRIDLVYEGAGASGIAFELIAELGANGIFMFTGVPGHKAPTPVDTDLLMRNIVLRNQILVGTVNAGREHYEAAISDLAAFDARWPDQVRGLITGRYPLSEHRKLLFGKAGGIKNVFALA
jgi:threonine dehydrogenase-like Zn-dependent dehydrogenase